jgi:hypothetical protein
MISSVSREYDERKTYSVRAALSLSPSSQSDSRTESKDNVQRIYNNREYRMTGEGLGPRSRDQV